MFFIVLCRGVFFLRRHALKMWHQAISKRRKPLSWRNKYVVIPFYVKVPFQFVFGDSFIRSAFYRLLRT